MAKISQLAFIAAPTGNEEVPVLSGGTVKRTRFSLLQALLNNSGQAALNAVAVAQSQLLTLSGRFVSIADGLAGTAENSTFSVVGPGDVAIAFYAKRAGKEVLLAGLPSRAALDRVGRFIPASTTTDMSVPINAALADPLVGGVFFGIGEYRLDHAVVVQSDKFLCGSGLGLTRLVRTDNIAASQYLDRAMIRLETNARGVRVSDLTVVAPKTPYKVTGVWAITARNFLIERVEAYNCGYAFFAMEYSQHGVFRACQSYNANVHFETTQAYDILFEDGICGAGDGDNPLGCEAWWHCLLASRRITFRNMIGSGPGQPYLIVANDINGDPLGGLVDMIRYESCTVLSMASSGICIFVSKYAGIVGRIFMKDCVNNVSSIIAFIQEGQVVQQNCTSRTSDATSYDVYPNATLDAIDCEVTVDNNEGSHAGYVYGGSAGGGNIRVVGGKINVLNGAPIVPATANVYVSPTTELLPIPNGPAKFNCWPNKPARRPLEVDTDNPLLVGGYYMYGPAAGKINRLRIKGLVKNTGAAGRFGFYIDPSSGLQNSYGHMRFQRSDGTYVEGSGSSPYAAVFVDVGAGETRMIDVELTWLGTDNGFAPILTALDGAAVLALAGMERVTERLN